MVLVDYIGFFLHAPIHCSSFCIVRDIIRNENITKHGIVFYAVMLMKLSINIENR